MPQPRNSDRPSTNGSNNRQRPPQTSRTSHNNDPHAPPPARTERVLPANIDVLLPPRPTSRRPGQSGGGDRNPRDHSHHRDPESRRRAREAGRRNADERRRQGAATYDGADGFYEESVTHHEETYIQTKQVETPVPSLVIKTSAAMKRESTFTQQSASTEATESTHFSPPKTHFTPQNPSQNTTSISQTTAARFATERSTFSLDENDRQRDRSYDLNSNHTNNDHSRNVGQSNVGQSFSKISQNTPIVPSVPRDIHHNPRHPIDYEQNKEIYTPIDDLSRRAFQNSNYDQSYDVSLDLSRKLYTNTAPRIVNDRNYHGDDQYTRNIRGIDDYGAYKLSNDNHDDICYISESCDTYDDYEYIGARNTRNTRNTAQNTYYDDYNTYEGHNLLYDRNDDYNNNYDVPDTPYEVYEGSNVPTGRNMRWNGPRNDGNNITNNNNRNTDRNRRDENRTIQNSREWDKNDRRRLAATSTDFNRSNTIDNRRIRQRLDNQADKMNRDPYENLPNDHISTEIAQGQINNQIQTTKYTPSECFQSLPQSLPQSKKPIEPLSHSSPLKVSLLPPKSPVKIQPKNEKIDKIKSIDELPQKDPKNKDNYNYNYSLHASVPLMDQTSSKSTIQSRIVSQKISRIEKNEKKNYKRTQKARQVRSNRLNFKRSWLVILFSIISQYTTFAQNAIQNTTKLKKSDQTDPLESTEEFPNPPIYQFSSLIGQGMFSEIYAIRRILKTNHKIKEDQSQVPLKSSKTPHVEQTNITYHYYHHIQSLLFPSAVTPVPLLPPPRWVPDFSATDLSDGLLAVKAERPPITGQKTDKVTEKIDKNAPISIPREFLIEFDEDYNATPPLSPASDSSQTTINDHKIKQNTPQLDLSNIDPTPLIAQQLRVKSHSLNHEVEILQRVQSTHRAPRYVASHANLISFIASEALDTSLSIQSAEYADKHAKMTKIVEKILFSGKKGPRNDNLVSLNVISFITQHFRAYLEYQRRQSSPAIKKTDSSSPISNEHRLFDQLPQESQQKIIQDFIYRAYQPLPLIIMSLAGISPPDVRRLVFHFVPTFQILSTRAQKTRSPHLLPHYSWMSSDAQNEALAQYANPIGHGFQNLEKLVKNDKNTLLCANQHLFIRDYITEHPPLVEDDLAQQPTQISLFAGLLLFGHCIDDFYFFILKQFKLELLKIKTMHAAVSDYIMLRDRRAVLIQQIQAEPYHSEFMSQNYQHCGDLHGEAPPSHPNQIEIDRIDRKISRIPICTELSSFTAEDVADLGSLLDIAQDHHTFILGLFRKYIQMVNSYVLLQYSLHYQLLSSKMRNSPETCTKIDEMDKKRQNSLNISHIVNIFSNILQLHSDEYYYLQSMQQSYERAVEISNYHQNVQNGTIFTDIRSHFYYFHPKTLHAYFAAHVFHLRRKQHVFARLPVFHGATVTIQMLETLYRIHSTGVIHRDIKPGNFAFPLAHAVEYEYYPNHLVDVSNKKTKKQLKKLKKLGTLQDSVFSVTWTQAPYILLLDYGTSTEHAEPCPITYSPDFDSNIHNTIMTGNHQKYYNTSTSPQPPHNLTQFPSTYTLSHLLSHRWSQYAPITTPQFLPPQNYITSPFPPLPEFRKIRLDGSSRTRGTPNYCAPRLSYVPPYYQVPYPSPIQFLPPYTENPINNDENIEKSATIQRSTLLFPHAQHFSQTHHNEIIKYFSQLIPRITSLSIAKSLIPPQLSRNLKNPIEMRRIELLKSTDISENESYILCSVPPPPITPPTEPFTEVLSPQNGQTQTQLGFPLQQKTQLSYLSPELYITLSTQLQFCQLDLYNSTFTSILSNLAQIDKTSPNDVLIKKLEKILSTIISAPAHVKAPILSYCDDLWALLFSLLDMLWGVTPWKQLKHVQTNTTGHLAQLNREFVSQNRKPIQIGQNTEQTKKYTHLDALSAPEKQATAFTYNTHFSHAGVMEGIIRPISEMHAAARASAEQSNTNNLMGDDEVRLVKPSEKHEKFDETIRILNNPLQSLIPTPYTEEMVSNYRSVESSMLGAESETCDDHAQQSRELYHKFTFSIENTTYNQSVNDIIAVTAESMLSAHQCSVDVHSFNNITKTTNFDLLSTPLPSLPPPYREKLTTPEDIIDYYWAKRLQDYTIPYFPDHFTHDLSKIYFINDIYAYNMLYTQKGYLFDMLSLKYGYKGGGTGVIGSNLGGKSTKLQQNDQLIDILKLSPLYNTQNFVTEIGMTPASIPQQIHNIITVLVYFDHIYPYLCQILQNLNDWHRDNPNIEDQCDKMVYFHLKNEIYSQVTNIYHYFHLQLTSLSQVAPPLLNYMDGYNQNLLQSAEVLASGKTISKKHPKSHKRYYIEQLPLFLQQFVASEPEPPQQDAVPRFANETSLFTNQHTLTCHSPAFIPTNKSTPSSVSGQLLQDFQLSVPSLQRLQPQTIITNDVTSHPHTEPLQDQYIPSQPFICAEQYPPSMNEECPQPAYHQYQSTDAYYIPHPTHHPPHTIETSIQHCDWEPAPRYSEYVSQPPPNHYILPEHAINSPQPHHSMQYTPSHNYHGYQNTHYEPQYHHGNDLDGYYPPPQAGNIQPPIDGGYSSFQQYDNYPPQNQPYNPTPQHLHLQQQSNSNLHNNNNNRNRGMNDNREININNRDRRHLNNQPLNSHNRGKRAEQRAYGNIHHHPYPPPPAPVPIEDTEIGLTTLEKYQGLLDLFIVPTTNALGLPNFYDC